MSFVEGLYRAEFRTALGEGVGTVVLAEGRIRGGDDMVAYVGNYKFSENKFEGHIVIITHTPTPGRTSVFGVDKAEVNLTGFLNEKGYIIVEGTSPNVPGIQMRAALDRICRWAD